jgi:hypothetical protein
LTSDRDEALIRQPFFKRGRLAARAILRWRKVAKKVEKRRFDVKNGLRF